MPRRLIPFLIAGLCTTSVSADELVYQPINPAFGGNPLNGNWLLNNAQAQDTFEDPDTRSSPDLARQSDLDRFNETLERIVLSRIATQLSEKFLEGEASFLETQNLLITTTTNPDGSTTITTTDKITGQVTEVVIE
jgi:curli production assembly/transport component CsgF